MFETISLAPELHTDADVDASTSTGNGDWVKEQRSDPNIGKVINFLYARLVGTYYGMARASVRPSVCLSVRPSVHKACKHDTD